MQMFPIRRASRSPSPHHSSIAPCTPDPFTCSIHRITCSVLCKDGQQLQSRIIQWFTMMVLHKRSTLLQKVDDTLGVFHTHVVAGVLGGALTGLLAEPALCSLFLPVRNSKGAFYGGPGGVQFLKQLAGACFIIGWNVVATSIILLVISLVIPLRMTDQKILIGDDVVHGEEAYALWGDGEKYDNTRHGWYDDTTHGDG